MVRQESAKLLLGVRFPSWPLMSNKRKYFVNEKFLSRWSSQMAYILGIWFADGYMRHDKSYRIMFNSNDYDIITEIRSVLKSNHKIHKWTDNCFRLIIYSKQMFFRLTKLGGLSAKSKIIKFPKVPILYLPDFIRGYFDGDGSVFYVNYKATKNNKTYRELRSNFTSGSLEFLTTLQNMLSTQLKLVKRKICPYDNDSSWKLGYGKKDTLKLLNYLYYPKYPIGLKRKACFLETFKS